MWFALRPATILALLSFAIVHPVAAQETFERTTNLSGGWVGHTGYVYLNLPYRLVLDAPGDAFVIGQPTFEVAMGLPGQLLAGGRFAPSSTTVPGRPDEWEAFARYMPLSQAHGRPFDLGITAAYNGASESFDAEVSIARWVGPVRLLGSGRGMTSALGSGDARLAAGAGAAFFPFRGHFPLALAGDVVTLLDRGSDQRVAWSAAIQLGLTHTTHTLSIFATNTPTSTLQGSSLGTDQLRFGFELTIPIPAGRFMGMFVPRVEARESVVEDPDVSGPVVSAEIRDYLFLPKRLEIERGTTVEWVNRDQDIHTVEADDGTWSSGAIPQGERWRARFDRPGRYAYYCGPHPFMRGIIVVR